MDYREKIDPSQMELKDTVVSIGRETNHDARAHGVIARGVQSVECTSALPLTCDGIVSLACTRAAEAGWRNGQALWHVRAVLPADPPVTYADLEFCGWEFTGIQRVTEG